MFRKPKSSKCPNPIGTRTHYFNNFFMESKFTILAPLKLKNRIEDMNFGIVVSRSPRCSLFAKPQSVASSKTTSRAVDLMSSDRNAAGEQHSQLFSRINKGIKWPVLFCPHCKSNTRSNTPNTFESMVG